MSPLYEKEMERTEVVSAELLGTLCNDFTQNREQLIASRKQAAKERKEGRQEQKRRKAAAATSEK